MCELRSYIVHHGHKSWGNMSCPFVKVGGGEGCTISNTSLPLPYLEACVLPVYKNPGELVQKTLSQSLLHWLADEGPFLCLSVYPGLISPMIYLSTVTQCFYFCVYDCHYLVNLNLWHTLTESYHLDGFTSKLTKENQQKKPQYCRNNRAIL